MQTLEQLSEAGTKGGLAFKHKWTEDEREIVRRDYDGHNRTAQLIATKLSYLTGERITIWAVKGQVQKLGIAQNKSPNWTPDQEEALKEMITRYCPSVVAKKLGRSLNAVVIKAKRLHCSRRVRDGWFTQKEVSEICGVDHRIVGKWVASGALKTGWHTDIKPQKNGGACWHILQSDFRDFLIRHSLELQGRNVDLFTIISILTQEGMALA